MSPASEQTSGRNLTLEQIGKRAGVSRSTVSRVLNEHPDVRPEVRARVEAVIQETGYLPNQAARSLVSSRTGLIGLVMLTEADELFGDPYYSELVNGIQQGCKDHGLIFSIFPVDGLTGRPDALVTQVAQGFVDGVIVTAGPRSEHVIAALRDRGKRLVVVGHPIDDADLMRVDVDNRSGSRAAVKHLLDHDYERIAFIGPTQDHLFGVERLDGYRDALVAAGRQVDDRLVRFDASTVQGGYDAMSGLLSEKPDAVHIATDPMAQGAFGAAIASGLHIPEDVAIIGFDGLPRGPRLEPALTTVVQPVGDVGRAAVAMLADETVGPRVVILPTALRIADSCGSNGDLHLTV